MAWLPRSLVQDLDAENQKAAVKTLADDVRRQRREASIVPAAVAEPEPTQQQPAAPSFDLGAHVQQLAATWSDQPEQAQTTSNPVQDVLGRLTSIWDNNKPQQQQPAPTPSGQPASMPSISAPFDDRPRLIPATITTGPRPGQTLQPGESVGSVTLAGGNFTDEERAAILQAAQEEGVPPDLIAAIWDTENSGANSVSSAGARGRGQVVPGQGYDLPGEDPSIPIVAARQTARALKDKARIAGGDWDEAGAAYFGYGTDSTGMDTNTYRERVRQNRMKYQGQAAQPQNYPERAGAPQPEARQYGQQGDGPAWGTYTKETLTPNQFTEGQEQGLTPDEALAVCGPAAAVAFSRANGRTPTLREAKEMAQSLGVWDSSTGMHGPASQVQLLERMGVKARLQQGTDWGAVAREVQSGRPVIVDTPQHYYVVTGYDAQTGEFEFGQSAGVLRASGGKTRWRPDELGSLGMGEARATIYMGAN